MSITEGTQPAAKTWTGAWTTAQTTASFTPESGALLVALLSGDGSAAVTTASISDSLGGSWTTLKVQNANAGTVNGICGVYVRDSPGASLTVSATATANSANGGQLVVRTLIGAKAAAQQNGATNGTTLDPGVIQVSVAAGTGNKIYGAAFNFANSTVMTFLANSTAVNQFSDTTNGDTWEAFKSSGDTAGTATYGYSTNTSGMIAAVEILAAPVAAGDSALQAAQEFPPFRPPFREPNAIPFQLLGDASGVTSISLTDAGVGDDSLTIAADVPLIDTGAAADSITVTSTDPNQAVPQFATMFLEPSGASFQLLGDATTNAPIPITLTDAGTGADTLSVSAAVPLDDAGTATDSISVNTGTDPYQASPQPFPPFTAPFTEPMVEPFQLLGDASGIVQVSLTDNGTGADALTITAAVPLSDAAAGADTLSIAATLPLSDTGAGADAVSVAAAVPLTDVGAGADAVALTAAVPLSETASADDSLSVSVQSVTDANQAIPKQFGWSYLQPGWVVPFQLLGDMASVQPSAGPIAYVEVVGASTAGAMDAGSTSGAVEGGTVTGGLSA